MFDNPSFIFKKYENFNKKRKSVCDIQQIIVLIAIINR